MAEYDIFLTYETCSSLISYDDEERYLVNVRIKIIGCPENSKLPDITLGEAQATQIRVRQALDNGERLFHIFDVDQSLMNAGTAVYNAAFTNFKPAVRRDFPYCQPDGDVLLIRQLVLQPQFRGKKLGLAVLRQIIGNLGYGCTLALIKPFPIDRERSEEVEGCDKLRAYWERLLFRRIGHSAFWGLCTLGALPSADELELPSSLFLKDQPQCSGLTLAAH
jgi:hypothetical protein